MKKMPQNGVIGICQLFKIAEHSFDFNTFCKLLQLFQRESFIGSKRFKWGSLIEKTARYMQICA